MTGPRVSARAMTGSVARGPSVASTSPSRPASSSVAGWWSSTVTPARRTRARISRRYSGPRPWVARLGLPSLTGHGQYGSSSARRRQTTSIVACIQAGPGRSPPAADRAAISASLASGGRYQCPAPAVVVTPEVPQYPLSTRMTPAPSWIWVAVSAGTLGRGREAR